MLEKLTHSHVGEVDPVLVPGHGGLVGEDLLAVLALDFHGDLVVHRHDVRVEGAPRGQVLAAPLALVVVGRHQALLPQVG